MARSKDFRKYTVVTKRPKYETYTYDADEETMDKIGRNHDDSLDKTFWLYDESGELVGRFSTASAPKWVMEIYKILTKEYG